MNASDFERTIIEGARLDRERREAALADLRNTIAESRRIIEESRKLLERLSERQS